MAAKHLSNWCDLLATNHPLSDHNHKTITHPNLTS